MGSSAAPSLLQLTSSSAASPQWVGSSAVPLICSGWVEWLRDSSSQQPGTAATMQWCAQQRL